MVSPSGGSAGVMAETTPTSPTKPSISSANAAPSSSSSSAISLTKKFTRTSLMRASGKPEAAVTTASNPTTTTDKQDALKMAGARSRALAMTHQRKQKNALLRVNPHSSINHRAAIAAATGGEDVPTSSNTKRIILSGNPYRRFEMSRYTSGAGGDDQSHADILTTMSSLTEPTWGGPMTHNAIPNSMSNLEIITPSRQERHHHNDGEEEHRDQMEDHHHDSKHPTESDFDRVDQNQQLQATTLHTRNGDGQQQEQRQHRRDGPPQLPPITMHDDDERRREERRARRRSFSRDGRRSRKSSSTSTMQHDDSKNASSPKSKDATKRRTKHRSMSVQPTSSSSRRASSDALDNEDRAGPADRDRRRTRSSSVNSTRVKEHQQQQQGQEQQRDVSFEQQHGYTPAAATNTSSRPTLCMADEPSRMSMLATSTVQGFQRPSLHPVPHFTSTGHKNEADDDDDLSAFEEASQHPNDTQYLAARSTQPKPQNAIQAARLALRQTQAIHRSHSSSRSVCSHQSNESNALRSLSSAAQLSVLSSATGAAAARAYALEKGRANISNRSVYPTSRSSSSPSSAKTIRKVRAHQRRTNVLVPLIAWVWKVVAVIVCAPITVMKALYRLVTLQFLFDHRRKPWTIHRKSVLILNAHTQLGWDLAQQLASEGAKLALVVSSSPSSNALLSNRQMEMMAETCRELGSSKCCVYLCNDTSNSTSIFLTLSQARTDFEGTSCTVDANRNASQSATSPFDVVVINGQTYSHGCTFEEIQDASHIETVVKQNVLGSILFAHHALPLLKKSQHSRLIVLSSKSGLISATPTQSVFGATQHALHVFTDSLRLELNEAHASKVNGAPKVCLVPLPDLSSNVPGPSSSNPLEQHLLNQQDRILDMGTILPATKTYSWATIPLQTAVSDIIVPTIKSGCQYHNHASLSPSAQLTLLSFHMKLYESLRPWFPSFVDGMLDRESKQTYYRPLQEKNNHHYPPSRSPGQSSQRPRPAR